jgi:hypothetical protein
MSRNQGPPVARLWFITTLFGPMAWLAVHRALAKPSARRTRAAQADGTSGLVVVNACMCRSAPCRLASLFLALLHSAPAVLGRDKRSAHEHFRQDLNTVVAVIAIGQGPSDRTIVTCCSQLRDSNDAELVNARSLRGSALIALAYWLRPTRLRVRYKAGNLHTSSRTPMWWLTNSIIAQSSEAKL